MIARPFTVTCVKLESPGRSGVKNLDPFSRTKASVDPFFVGYCSSKGFYKSHYSTKKYSSRTAIFSASSCKQLFCDFLIITSKFTLYNENKIAPCTSNQLLLYMQHKPHFVKQMFTILYYTLYCILY